MPRDHPELPPLVSLSRSALGGFTVGYDGTFIGWIHESGGLWNAYLRSAKVTEHGTPLGRFTKHEAVLRIAVAAGRIEPPALGKSRSANEST